jgi:hypothetical protein
VDQISGDYFRSLYGPAAVAMQAQQQAARALFDTEFGHGQTGEEMLFGFRIKKFNPESEASSKAEFNDAVAKISESLAAADSVTTDPWVSRRVEILNENAQLMGHIYGILNEAAGFKVDNDAARKDAMRKIIARVGQNEVVTKHDFRCKIFKSLMPHVESVLGADNASKYDRVAVAPQE